MMATDFRCWRQNHYADDFFRYVGHQHLKLVINTFGLQHPSPTSMYSLNFIIGKALLLQYTDVIFECKNCRTLFRKIQNNSYPGLADCCNGEQSRLHSLGGAIPWFIFILNSSRQLSKFVEHKKVCHADIQSGLTFNGTDLGCRGASQLEETLKVKSIIFWKIFNFWKFSLTGFFF